MQFFVSQPETLSLSSSHPRANAQGFCRIGGGEIPARVIADDHMRRAVCSGLHGVQVHSKLKASRSQARLAERWSIAARQLGQRPCRRAQRIKQERWVHASQHGKVTSSTRGRLETHRARRRRERGMMAPSQRAASEEDDDWTRRGVSSRRVSPPQSGCDDIGCTNSDKPESG